MKTGVENALPTPGGGSGKSWELSLYDQHRTPHEPITDGTEITVSPRSLNSELMCPICLDMLKNTMTTKECLHRFCQECITTALRSGNKECPTCRKKLVSKRSLRPDPNFDALISKLYPDRKEYEAMQERALAKLSEHYNTEALQKSIEEGMKLQAQLRKMHRATGMNAATPSQEDGAAIERRHKRRRLNEDGSRRQTPDRESSLGEMSASEASAAHFAKSRASEVELILKPHPDTEREPSFPAVVKQTRYLKTTANATMDHLATYLSIRVKLDADEAMRNNVESSLEAFKKIKPAATSSPPAAPAPAPATAPAAAAAPAPAAAAAAAPTPTPTPTPTPATATAPAPAPAAETETSGTPADVGISQKTDTTDGQENAEGYKVYIDQGGTGNSIMLLPGNMNLETVVGKYWSVSKPLELYFLVPVSNGSNDENIIPARPGQVEATTSNA